MTKLNQNFPEGVVLLITEDGTVTEILHDTFDIFSVETDSKPSFTDFLKNDSIKKGCRFIESIDANDVAYSWELYIERQDETSLFNFSGVKTENEIVLIGSPNPDDMELFLNGLMEINNEQVNKLRLFMKENQKKYLEENEWTLFDEMSGFNNELANTKRELTKKTAELERLNELKNQMMGMAAHDLRNPLMLIQNFADFLIVDHQEEVLFTEEQFQLINEIKGSSEYMIQIIEDMLDISTFESRSISLKKKNSDLVELVKDAVSLSRTPAGKKNIGITTLLPDSSVNKLIDTHKFRQVLDNLLSNAVKYSNPDTEIEVGIKQFDGSEGVTIFVKDQGQGIPEDEIDKLFEPFSKISVKSTAGEKSTGLGLAIVQKIVEAHGGKIEVESEVGAGSTFVVKIP
ncbi:MAG: HAMP domain-containing sensor histidine kinase [Rhodohalobacter sp.]|uniref:sensor histidine kinase n=2 Tax=Rhodohalobacter sp. TaxID=1974210 RepID=UPI003976DBC0